MRSVAFRVASGGLALAALLAAGCGTVYREPKNAGELVVTATIRDEAPRDMDMDMGG